MSIRGYYRHPTIHDETIVFVTEDDLWQVGAGGGLATRLTANPGSHTYPHFSPDGRRLAFISRDEGRPEVHTMDASGGESRRLSHLGATTQVIGWRPDGTAVIAASDHRQPFAGWLHLWNVPVDGSQPEPLGHGPGYSLAFGPKGATAIGRNSFDPARWKRYRGGRAGNIWVDRTGTADFEPLVVLDGNLASPMWIGRRIYFLSDHEGTGNIYSVTPTGSGLTRHTEHDGFYARFPSTDGRRIVYHCGADVWLLDPGTGENRLVDIEIVSARSMLNRRYVPAAKRLESVDLHPEGHSLALVARGASFTAPLWEGAPSRLGEVSSVRQRLTTWLPDGERVVAVSDASGEERLVVQAADGSGDPTEIGEDLGRIRTIDAAPAGPVRVAVTNHRHELWLVDVSRRSARRIHHSPHSWIAGVDWSPDGRWLAFGASTTRTTSNIHLYDTKNRRTRMLGEPEFVDHTPTFGPDGRWLGFLSSRSTEPVPDTVFHDYGFPRSTLPMLVTLQAGEPSPFSVAGRTPRAPGAPPPTADQKNGREAEGEAGGDDVEVEIDFDGIDARVVAFPVPVGRYRGMKLGRGRAWFMSWPIVGSTAGSLDEERPQGTLQVWDFTSDRVEVAAEGLSGFGTSMDAKTLVLVTKGKVRVVPAAWKDDKSGKDQPSRETGWIDLSRFRVEVRPTAEWHQMFTEAWRLQRDYFWAEDMSGVDWLGVHERYGGMVDRLGARSEFSDLMWEMQGELGTSHAYELGGDYLPEPTLSLGRLGADLSFRRGAWRVDRIPAGDEWDARARSPLAAPGVEIQAGDRILAVDGVALDRTTSPDSCLVDRAKRPVRLTVARGRRSARTVVVEPLASEVALRYRDWVEHNRAYVREHTDGRVGYIHIPDMQAPGFAEFHRSWRFEVDKDGLVIDVRFNRGGNVSQLLLEKLARRRVGFRVTRWRPPYPLPTDAPAGPMVCLTNEMAGSDGDIFSHTFKMARLGPLIGTRTWGGVVGIWPQQSLVDGTVTTQPEFGTWFEDVGFRVENYGTDPDIEVTAAPHEADRDPQLDRGITEIARLLEEAPGPPEFEALPSTAAPRLPRA